MAFSYKCVPSIFHRFLTSHQCLPSQVSPDMQHCCHLALATSEISCFWRVGIHGLISNHDKHNVLFEYLLYTRRNGTLLSSYCRIWGDNEDMRFVGARINMERDGTAFPFWRPQPYCVLKGSVLVTTTGPVTSGNNHKGSYWHLFHSVNCRKGPE